MPTQFEDILQKLDANETWDFPGGVHPPQHKQLSNQTPIAQLTIPEHLYVPVKQHIGIEGHVIVEVGQHVLKGQALTKSMNPFAVPIHAPTSGHITGIGPHISAHPSGLEELTIEIHSDQQDTWTALSPLVDYQSLPKMTVLSAICDSGISGMGGAGFPTHIKSAPKKNVEFLIINGIECEPYISSDDRLMREHAWQIRQGIDVLTHLLSPQIVLIGIEDNKPEAIEAMQLACRENAQYRICVIPTKYPAGGEKQLIQMLTNREVPSGGLPVDVGVIMHNVGTCYAIADAIFSGKPLIQRVVTVTGQAVKHQGNYWTLIGTPIEHLLSHSEYQASQQKTPTVIMGGPMMGFTIASQQVPVVKITNCILVPNKKELAGNNEQACIRCGACADACPASLLPQQLFWHAKAKELDKAQEYNLFDCIECGACAFVCPSEIPLVHYYRIAKAEVRIEQQEKQKADKARERFESRAARLVAEQEARDEKHRLAAEARKQAMSQSGNDAKDKIAAALARAKEKKQTHLSQSDTTNTDSLGRDSTDSMSSAPETSQPASKNERVQAAIARAKAKKEANADTSLPAGENDIAQQESKNDRVQAAIARAKAKKEANADTSLPAGENDIAQQESKNERVQAAIARAKAKKAANAKLPEASANTENIAQSQEPSKSERVKVAITRTKAKKAASAEAQQTAKDIDGTQQEDKSERVQTAIDRVKAKKAVGATSPLTTDETIDTTSSKVVDTQGKAKDSASDTDSIKTNSQQNTTVKEQLDDKQRRITTAVAKAKAKRIQSRNDANEQDDGSDAKTSSDQSDTNLPQQDNKTNQSPISDNDVLADKKRRIASAVAKAKAKKAAEKSSKDESQ